MVTGCGLHVRFAIQAKSRGPIPVARQSRRGGLSFHRRRRSRGGQVQDGGAARHRRGEYSLHKQVHELRVSCRLHAVRQTAQCGLNDVGPPLGAVRRAATLSMPRLNGADSHVPNRSERGVRARGVAGRQEAGRGARTPLGRPADRPQKAAQDELFEHGVPEPLEALPPPLGEVRCVEEVDPDPPELGGVEHMFLYYLYLRPVTGVLLVGSARMPETRVTFLEDEDGYQLEIVTSRAATSIVSLGDYVELFYLSSTPPPLTLLLPAAVKGVSPLSKAESFSHLRVVAQ